MDSGSRGPGDRLQLGGRPSWQFLNFGVIGFLGFCVVQGLGLRAWVRMSNLGLKIGGVPKLGEAFGGGSRTRPILGVPIF